MERKAWLVAAALGATLAGTPGASTRADDVLDPGQLVLEVTYVPEVEPSAPSFSPWAVGWHLGCTRRNAPQGTWHGRVQLRMGRDGTLLPANATTVVVMSEDR